MGVRRFDRNPGVDPEAAWKNSLRIDGAPHRGFFVSTYSDGQRRRHAAFAAENVTDLAVAYIQAQREFPGASFTFVNLRDPNGGGELLREIKEEISTGSLRGEWR